jgi:hypothetical protein
MFIAAQIPSLRAERSNLAPPILRHLSEIASSLRSSQ